MIKGEYKKLDMEVYSGISRYLPEKILDFHTHIWKEDHWKKFPWETDVAGGRYMVTDKEYPAEQLISDMRYLFPDRKFSTISFGMPNPSFDAVKSNAYVVESAGKYPEILPLLLVKRGIPSKEEIEYAVCEKGCLGYKVMTPWQGNNYGSTTVKK